VPLDAPLTAFADGVWVTTAPVRYLGMHLTATMTILRLGNGSLLLHSPVPMTPALRDAVEALGPVAHLYAPNTFHHMHVGEWAAAFPSARLHAPPGLAKKRRDLRIDRTHGSDDTSAAARRERPHTWTSFDGVVDELRIEGFRMEETVLLYRPGRTLVVADLLHNIGRPAHGWTRFYAKIMGFYDTVAVSRMIRAGAFSDRSAARQSLDRVLAWPFDRIVVGHGAPVTASARDALAAAYGWLPPRAQRARAC
jgi:hypothetical protein